MVGGRSGDVSSFRSGTGVDRLNSELCIRSERLYTAPHDTGGMNNSRTPTDSGIHTGTTGTYSVSRQLNFQRRRQQSLYVSDIITTPNDTAGTDAGTTTGSSA
eukprot:Lankesteria_metandrocarpae@DN9391_c0_g1_i1.p2